MQKAFLLWGRLSVSDENSESTADEGSESESSQPPGFRSWQGRAAVTRNPLGLARLDDIPAEMSHAGWPIDSQPDLPMFDAGAEMVVAEIDGPAVMNTIHVSRALDPPRPFETRRAVTVEEQRAIRARDVVLEITFDGATAATTYWYAQSPGHDHDPLPPVPERTARVLGQNPSSG